MISDTITIRVQLFGVLAQRIGLDAVIISLPAPVTVKLLLAALAQQHEAIAAMHDKLAVAVNLEYVRAEDQVKQGDEVALIPPVSGG